MDRVLIYYIKHQGVNDLDKIDDRMLQRLLAELSPGKQESIQRLLNNKDRVTSLLGVLLLKIYTQAENINNFCLRNVCYPVDGKPYCKVEKEVFDFNISHSDNLIVLAASKNVKVGVDAEKIRQLKSLKFKKIMQPEELDRIEKEPELFFDLWSKKEAVVKAADTAGLVRMRDVELNENKAFLDEATWYLKKIELSAQMLENYSINLATSKPVEEVIIKQVQLSEINS